MKDLREPLQDLPEDEWRSAEGDFASDTRTMVGTPRELGIRVAPDQVSIRAARGRGGGRPSELDHGGLTADPEPIALSSIEQQYRGHLAERPARTLRQFGYDQLERLAPAVGGIDEAGSDDHVLVPGDEVIIDLTTDRVERFRPRVDADGSLEIEGLLSVRVAGMRFDAARTLIESEVARLRTEFELSLGLGRLASVPIRVTGEALRPGIVQVGSRPTLMDALGASGIRRSGSLRRITVLRADGTSEAVDLYSYFMGLEAVRDIRLNRGDTVRIPPIGPTIAVAGSVQRPGIFELHPEEACAVASAINLAGGLTGFAVNSHMQIERTADGGRVLVDVVEQSDESVLINGDLLLVGAVDGRLHPIVEVRGEVARPGRFQHRGELRVSDLLRLSGGLTVDAHTRQAVISRLSGDRSDRHQVWLDDPDATSRRVLVIDLERALAKDPEHDVLLEPLDLLRVRSFHDAIELPTVEIIGAVRRPGLYELTAGLSVSDLLAIAGNLEPDAYREEAELVRRVRRADAMQFDVSRYRISLRTILDDAQRGPTLRNGDRLIIRSMRKAEVRVSITGEVQFPGEYVLPAGSRITDLMAAAGGVLDGADLRAARFTRVSVRAQQRSRWEELVERTRQQLERNVEARVNGARSKEAMAAGLQLNQALATLDRLRVAQVDGRVVLAMTEESFPDSASNLVLESGDALRVPKAESTVTVQGHVFNPLTVVHDGSVTPGSLIDRAGGLRESADQDHIYVVRADGHVARLARHGGQYPLDAPLYPGDVLLVPPDPIGRDATSVILDALLLARTAGEAASLWNLATSDLDDASLSIIDSPASPRSDSGVNPELIREFNH